MPLYLYLCEQCNTEFELLLKMCEMEKPLNNPCPDCDSEGHITQQLTAANFGDPIRMGHLRPDAGWGDVLSKVKKAHPRGNWSNKKFTPLAGR